LQLNDYVILDEMDNILKEFHFKFGIANVQQNQKALMVVMNDISEKLKLRESLISNQLKTIMLWSISHEIRSPVNQINGTLSLLKPSITDPKQRNLLEIAQSASEWLKYKVDDLLDFWELETNNFKIKKEFYSVNENMKKLETMFAPLINRRAIKLLFYVQGEIPGIIFQDSKRIMQILVNLVSNAVKYTPKGSIAIIVNWIENKNDQGEITSSFIKYVVSDTGIGISEDKKRSLFKFLQHDLYKDIDNINSSNEVTTKLAGTGLGVSQKIVQKLGGEIKFISTLNVGSKFWFEIPCETEVTNELLLSNYASANPNSLKHISKSNSRNIELSNRIELNRPFNISNKLFKFYRKSRKFWFWCWKCKKLLSLSFVYFP
jgi:signal transduction histidine kinase